MGQASRLPGQAGSLPHGCESTGLGITPIAYHPESGRRHAVPDPHPHVLSIRQRRDYQVPSVAALIRVAETSRQSAAHADGEPEEPVESVSEAVLELLQAGDGSLAALDIPELEDQKQLTGTLRQQMEQHRANAVCASCHRRMDPIGFAFENFDPVGRWRDKDAAGPLDASGVLPDGRTFAGPAGLKKLLRADRAAFVRCVAEKMLTYAVGRGLEAYDRRAVNRIVDATAAEGDRWQCRAQIAAQ